MSGSHFQNQVTAPAFVLSSPRWEDLRVPMTSTKLGGSKDPGFALFKDNGSASQGVFAYLFDKTSEEELYFSVQLPHAWQAGTALEPHVHWCPIDTDAGTVVWGLEYTWASMGAAFGVTTIIKNTAQAAGGVAYMHKLADLGSMSGTGKDISSMIVCRIFRDVASDNYNNDAALLEVDFHYRTDTPGGSDLETSKT